eukprot:216484_1
MTETQFNKIKTTQKRLEFLFLKCKWRDLLKYLHDQNSLIGQEIIGIVADLNANAKAHLCSCYDLRLRHESKIKSILIRKFDNTIQSLYDSRSYDDRKLCERIDELLTMIRLKYLRN